MGRPRKPESEIIKTITINLQQSIIENVAKDGEPKQVIQQMVIDKYGKK
jgi:hypothetical protein